MKNSKRILALLLCTLMVLALVPALSAYAESYSGTCGENVTWELDTNTGVLTISGTGEITCDDGTPWYDYNDQITSVIIDDGVTRIGHPGLFSDYTNLTNVTIGTNLTNIFDYTFYGCTALTSITIPDSVTEIGWSSFFECTSLSSVTIGNSVTNIDAYAFCGCSSLTSITIPTSVTQIGDFAFLDCTGMTSITIPNSVTSLGWAAFDSCTSLEKVAIPSSITNIGIDTFKNCTSLTDVYYSGSEEEWNAMTIVDYGNDCLTNATIHYNSASVNSTSTDEISVTLNGSKITFDQQPIIIDGRTMVPLRAIFEALGASVDWDNSTQTVTAEKDGTIVKMTIGQTTMYVNDSAVTLDVAPQLVNSRTLVPARAVAESFNCNVDWNNDTRTVIITY